MFPPLSISRLDPDAAIRSTDDDAAQSRLSAVRKGYLEDPFVHLFVPRAHLAPSRPPLINIGTYLRFRAIDALVQEFIEHWPDGRVQIVSLGAGSDTRFWRLNVSLDTGRGRGRATPSLRIASQGRTAQVKDSKIRGSRFPRGHHSEGHGDPQACGPP